MSRLVLNLAKTSLQPVISTAANANLVAVTGAVAGMELSGLQTTSIFATGETSNAQQELFDAYTKLSISSAYSDQLVASAGSPSSISFLNEALKGQSSLLEDWLPNDLLPSLNKLENLLREDANFLYPNIAQDTNNNNQEKDNSSNTDFVNKSSSKDIPDRSDQGGLSDISSPRDLPSASRLTSADGGGESNLPIAYVTHTFVSQGNHQVVDGTNDIDTLIGSLTGDTLIGHAGNDFYYVQSNQSVILENPGNGYDSLLVGVENYQTNADIELIKVSQNSTNYLSHTQSPDALLKNIDLGWHINGSNIAQTLIGGTQSDVLNGMGGIDTLIGGAGDDVYYFSGVENIIESSNQGVDTVKASANYVLDNNIENALVDSNASFVNLTGNQFDNILVGGHSANTLTGNDGNDTLLGNGGEDIYIGGTGADTFVLNSSENFAGEIKDYEVGQDKIVFSLPAAQQPPTLSFSDTDFTGVSGEVLLLDGMIQVDWNGDAVSDVLVLINALPNISDISFVDPNHLPGV